MNVYEIWLEGGTVPYTVVGLDVSDAIGTLRNERCPLNEESIVKIIKTASDVIVREKEVPF